MAKTIGTLGTIPQIEMAGRLFPDPVRSSPAAAGDTIVLSTTTINGAGTTFDYGSLRLAGQTTGYQVPAALQLRILSVKIVNLTAVAAYIDIGYADNDPAAATAPYHNTLPTTPVYAGGGTIGSVPFIPVGATVGAEGNKSLDMIVAATKFLQVSRAGGTAGVIVEVIGVLETP